MRETKCFLFACLSTDTLTRTHSLTWSATDIALSVSACLSLQVQIKAALKRTRSGRLYQSAASYTASHTLSPYTRPLREPVRSFFFFSHHFGAVCWPRLAKKEPITSTCLLVVAFPLLVPTGTTRAEVQSTTAVYVFCQVEFTWWASQCDGAITTAVVAETLEYSRTYRQVVSSTSALHIGWWWFAIERSSQIENSHCKKSFYTSLDFINHWSLVPLSAQSFPKPNLVATNRFKRHICMHSMTNERYLVNW